MKNFLFNKKGYIIGGVILLLLGALALYYFSSNEEISQTSLAVVTTTTKKAETKFYIDVKGAVKKPGVYEAKEGDRVIDAITLAGGLTKSANTGNINLAERLKSEMVVYIYTDSEVKKGNNKITCDTTCNCESIEINNCIENESSSDASKTTLVNINTASKNELMTLSGIGESKAEAIISYREDNGSFKTIAELKNVSGIGDAMFERIKEHITI